MEGLDTQESWEVLRHTSPAIRAQIFSYFDREKQIASIESIDRAEIGHLITDLAPDERVDILDRVDSAIRDQILTLLPADERRDILRLSTYPAGTAGAVMTTQFARLSAALTVSEALADIRKQKQQLETIYYLYVVDEGDHLRGLISLRQLVLADPGERIGELMERETVSVLVTDDQEVVAKKLAKFDFLAIPVIDQEQRLVGIVTHDDVMDVVVDEATEDAHRMGGVAPLEEDYLQARFATIWWKRSVWLSCLFMAELFTFTALAHYENAIAAVLVLSLFVPLCISTGGNSGSQAATLITRAMALGQVKLSDWVRVLRHELGMGIALGLTLGLIGFVRASLTPQDILGNVDRWMLALAISQSVAAICLWGTLVGSMLPLVFKRLGFDPGYASSPFVATFVDVTGIVIYFSIARIYLL